MPDHPQPALGPLETLVMDALWERGSGTPREVAEALREGAPRAYTTIMTILGRLYAKGLLDRQRAGLAWRYRPRLSSAEFGRALAAERARVLVAEHGVAGLAAVIQAAAATDATLLDTLERLIGAART